MNLSEPSALSCTGPSIGDQLRERCRALGLAIWRCDNTGLILSEPQETGPIGLLLSSSAFTGMIAAAVRRWAPSDKCAPIEVFPGCWLIPLEESHRRKRTGFTILAAFGPESLDGPGLKSACAETQLDHAATRKSLMPRARYSEHAAAALQQALRWMCQDLARAAEGDNTAASFTRQLTDAYETIDLLYSLGRSMNDLNHPDRFIARICERLRLTLGFGWVAAWVADDARPGYAAIPARTFTSGELNVEQPALLRGIRKVLACPAGDDQAPARTILTELDGRALNGAGQVLVQPVMRGPVAAAAIAAGDKSGIDPQVSGYDIQLLEAAAGFIGAFLDNAALYADQEAMFLGTLVALTSSIDAKDRYTCGHSQRVAHLSHELALLSGMGREQADRIRIAGLVHDVGKIGVPEAVLCKAGKLTEGEFSAIKKHPEIGHRILRDIPQMDDLLPGVLHHHERFDGRGYPHGLKSTSIPLSGRIIAIADTFDAMSSTRSYRAAMPRHTVLAELQRCAGTQLDPELVPLFVALDFSTYDRMVAEHAAGAEAPMQLAKAA